MPVHHIPTCTAAMVADRLSRVSAESKLTKRELEILILLIEGAGNQEIAETIGCAKRTVDAHIRNAMEKTATTTRTELAIHALRTGLVPLHPDHQGARGGE